MAAPEFAPEFAPSGYEVPEHMLPWLTAREITDLDQILAQAREAARVSMGCGKTAMVMALALHALDKLLEYEELVKDRKERGFV